MIATEEPQTHDQPAPVRERHAIAAALDEIARLLQLTDDNPYRARAYWRAARSIEGLAEDLDRLASEGRLTDIPGVGASIAGVIHDLRTTGHVAVLDELRATYGPGFRELAEIRGLNPARIQALWHALGIDGVEALRTACEAGRVRTVKGFGPRTEARLLEEIARRDDRRGQILLVDARTIAAALAEHLAGGGVAASVDVVGSVRRWQETVSGIDLLATVPPAAPAGAREAVIDRFVSAPHVVRVVSREVDGGSLRAEVVLPQEARAVLWVAPAEERAYHLVRLTGARAHVVKLGLAPTLRGCASEEEIYRRIGLPWLPPELREDVGEIEAARAGDSFADLVTVEDLRGATHCHTTHSDGKASVEEMVRAAAARGWEYVTITDHSPSAHYAGGVRPEELAAQWAEIDEARARVGIDVLRGTESDILGDGSLDYDPAVLDRLDVVIASIHSRMKMSREEMTERLTNAMRTPWFKIWGHALGRLVLHRPPIDCDVEAVLDAAAASPTAVEINGDPARLDLAPPWARRARERGLRFVISTDAHAVSHYENVHYGVATARRGWIRRQEVLNTLDAQAFREAVRPRRAEHT